jgi:hypothetical protein
VACGFGVNSRAPFQAHQETIMDDIEQDDFEPATIIRKRRLQLPSGYPVLAQIIIDPADYYRFNQLVGDTSATRIISHDDPQDGWLTVHVACASDDVRDRLEDGWA